MLNNCEFIGNLGKDPEIRATQNGSEVANLSLGVTEKWKDKNGEQQSKTEWVRVTVFSEGLVGVIKNYTKKGSKLYVCGKLQTRKWQDQSGQDKYSTEIVLQGFNGKIILLDSKGEEKSPSQSPQHNQATQSFVDSQLDDDIPF